MSAAPTLRVALLGNPNAGKTSLFNALTGLRHKVANFPGVTVEARVGRVATARGDVELMDLPGTYSLAAHSPDEMVAVDALLGRTPGSAAPDGVLAVVDASNLDRNLYLVSQLLELDLPVAVALNMVDVAETRGVRIDPALLAERLGVPVVATRADRGAGAAEVRQVFQDWMAAPRLPAPAAPFALPAGLAEDRDELARRLAAAANGGPAPDWHPFEVLRLLVDEDGHAERTLRARHGAAAAAALAEVRGPAPEVPRSALEAQARYRWIRQATRDAVVRTGERTLTLSDRIDRILTHRVAGSLVFLGVMLLLFQCIFTWAAPVMDGIEAGIGWLGTRIAGGLPDGALKSLVLDGVFAGAGAVLVFLPQILFLFLFLGLLEDCGYMARAAFLMDRLMSFCGLSGKSFLPMLSGFACAVPAVLGARVIENRRDRIATILVTPLMTCSARLPLYTILIGAFVAPRRVLPGLDLQAVVMLGLYLVGILTAMAMALLFKKTLLAGPTPSFILELPSYKMPRLGALARRLGERAWSFVGRAGTTILAMSCVVWALAWFPHSQARVAEFQERRAAVAESPAPDQEARLAALDVEERAAHLEASFIGQLGRGIAPVFAPLGWDWRITVASLASFPAREIVVSTLGTIFELGDADLDEGGALPGAMRGATRPDGRPLFTLPVALSLLVFFALCCQCAATIAVVRKETGTWGWAAFTFGYMTALAWLGGAAVYLMAGWWS